MESWYPAGDPAVPALMLLGLLAGSCLPLVLLRLNRARAPTPTRNAALAVVALTTRFGFLLVILTVLGRAAGPDKAAWALHGTGALEGLLPYLDYPSVYGPFFSYVLAPGCRLLGPAAGPVVTFIVFDLLTVFLLLRATSDRELNWRAAWLYAASPLSWYFVVRLGQDEAIGAFFVVVLLLAARAKRDWILAVTAGLAAAVTKVLFLLAAFPVAFARRHRLRNCILAPVVLAACCLPFALAGGNVMQWAERLNRYGGPSRWYFTGPSLWQVLRDFGAEPDRLLTLVVFLLAMSSIVVFVCVRGHRAGVVPSAVMIYAGYMLTAPGVACDHQLLFLPFLCLWIGRSRKRHDLALFSVYGLLMAAQFDMRMFGVRGLLNMADLVPLVSLLIVAYHAYLLAGALPAAKRATPRA